MLMEKDSCFECGFIIIFYNFNYNKKEKNKLNGPHLIMEFFFVIIVQVSIEVLEYN